VLFNSLDFAVFLPIVFVLYWAVQKWHIRVQNSVIVAASYMFYGWWDARFLALIAFSTLVDYVAGIQMANTNHQAKRNAYLWLSIVVNIGMLGFFKYYNFFAENFIEAFNFLGYTPGIQTLEIILPVGISFYTFQTMSYSLDVYKGKLQPTKDWISFAAYVSFFPQLVAGPIERATQLLPQFYRKRAFDYGLAADGVKQIAWGLFKKIVVADSCAVFVNMAFANPETQTGSTLAVASIFFAFQIYGDFSGYSDIAIGTARLFGFSLMQNFAFPYFSRDIAEFWRRWHISLSTWFRDYVYIPLGGSHVSILKRVVNTFVIFLLSGFWHGANWTFVAWGLFNALLFMPLMLMNMSKNNIGNVAERTILPSLKESAQMLLTFVFVVMAWIFFRSNDLSTSFTIFKKIFSEEIMMTPSVNAKTLLSFCWISVLLLFEWFARKKAHALESFLLNYHTAIRWAVYYILFLLIVIYGGSEQQFIYFQF
jgi:D-alanyl-lipoteichoic acid acyltransferase DltB (MBOAT superfamily)